MRIIAVVTAVALGAMSFVAAPALAGLDGSSVSYGYYFPNDTSVYPLGTASPANFVIGAGSESILNLEGVTFITTDFTNTSLTLFFDTTLATPTFTNLDFNGLIFSGAGLGTITSVTVDGSSTLGINPADIAVVGNDLRLDWGGVSYLDGQTLTLNFTFAAVPEPASWAMLIAGFGLVGATMRRRRAVAA